MLPALRALIRTPRFTLAAVLTLTLGLGGALSMFSAFHRLLLQKPPYAGSERIYQLGPNRGQEEEYWGIVSRLYAKDMAEASPGLEVLGFLESNGSLRWNQDGKQQELRVYSLDPGLQQVLGLQAARGSLFGPEHALHGRGVLLTHAFWQRAFGGDPAIIGRSMRFSTQEQPIIGVLPPGVEIPMAYGAECFRPLQPQPEDRRSWFTARAFVRLRPGISREQGILQLQTAALNLAQSHPKAAKNLSATLVPLRKAINRKVDAAFFLVGGLAALLLLMACLNAASLFLARASDRHWETAVRRALGAPASALFRGFLVEGLLVSLASGLLGLGFAALLGRFLQEALPEGKALPSLEGAWTHPVVLLGALALVLVLGPLLSLLPMLQARRLDLARAVQDSRRTQSSRGRTRSALTVLQVAAAFVLIWGGSLLGRSLWKSLTEDLGFETRQRVVVNLDYNRAGKDEQGAASMEGLLAALRSTPDIQGAGLAGAGVMQGNMLITLQLEGDAEGTDHGMIGVDQVTPGYLEALGIQVKTGRYPTWEDARLRTCLVDEDTARKYWPQGALGQRIGSPKHAKEIIGVFRNYRPWPEMKPGPQLIECWNATRNLYLHTDLPLKHLQPLLTRLLAEHDPQARIEKLQQLEGLRWKHAEKRRQLIGLLGVLAALALLLSTGGLATLLWDNVSRTRRELGIRSALGATPNNLALRVLGAGLGRTLLGLALGGLFCAAASRFLESQLYGVKASDPAAALLACAGLCLLTLLGLLIPALRAARLDPARALKED